MTEKDVAVSEPVCIELLMKHGEAFVMNEPRITPSAFSIDSEFIPVRRIGFACVPTTACMLARDEATLEMSTLDEIVV